MHWVRQNPPSSGASRWKATSAAIDGNCLPALDGMSGDVTVPPAPYTSSRKQARARTGGEHNTGGWMGVTRGSA